MSTEDRTSEGHGSDSNSVAPGDAKRPDWLKRVMTVLVGLLLGFLIWKVSAAYFPRAWARFVGDDVGGSLVSGWLWGLFYGFVFSLVPVLVLAQARRPVFGWPAKLVVVVVAVLMATPNLLTAAVVWGTNSSAHAGQRILDVDAPGFRAGTVLGVALGVGLAVVVIGFFVNRRRLKAKLADMQAQLKGTSDGAKSSGASDA